MQKYILILLSLLITPYLTAQGTPDPADTVATGKMWTFTAVPREHLEKTYGFKATPAWLKKARLGALKYAGGATASFVSANGLIMTNYHCVKFALPRLAREYPGIGEAGFLARKLSEEIEVPRLYVDQLEKIIDVTEQMEEALAVCVDGEQRRQVQRRESRALCNKHKKPGLLARYVSQYSGGKHLIHLIRRYRNLRFVFVPDRRIAEFGGDLDNFTFPRYNLDCAFLRAYDSTGKPVQTPHFYRFNTKNIPADEPVFTVGNPGRTERLKTLAQLELDRDFSAKSQAFHFNGYYHGLERLKAKFPDRAAEFEKLRTRLGNTQKVVDRLYASLCDPILMAKKRAFEERFRAAVMATPALAEKYGKTWDDLAKLLSAQRRLLPTITAFSANRRFKPRYFNIAATVLKEVGEENPEAATARATQILSRRLDPALDPLRLQIQADLLREILGADHGLVKTMFGGRTGRAAAEYAITNSVIMKEDSLATLIQGGKKAIAACQDPFLLYQRQSQKVLRKILPEYFKLNNRERQYNRLIGQALLAVYGNNVPPDAGGTLRLSDGMLTSVPYNGTIAPTFTTFHGLYDRYYSFKGKYPFGLTEKWLRPNPDFDRATPFNFITTNDIIGGNSGSAMIDRNCRVVGLAFDGNIHSIAGNYLYRPENNRCIGVTALGMLAAIKHIFKAKELHRELTTGKRTREL